MKLHWMWPSYTASITKAHWPSKQIPVKSKCFLGPYLHKPSGKTFAQLSNVIILGVCVKNWIVLFRNKHPTSEIRCAVLNIALFSFSKINYLWNCDEYLFISFRFKATFVLESVWRASVGGICKEKQWTPRSRNEGHGRLGLFLFCFVSKKLKPTWSLTFSFALCG